MKDILAIFEVSFFLELPLTFFACIDSPSFVIELRCKFELKIPSAPEPNMKMAHALR